MSDEVTKPAAAVKGVIREWLARQSPVVHAGIWAALVALSFLANKYGFSTPQIPAPAPVVVADAPKVVGADASQGVVAGASIRERIFVNVVRQRAVNHLVKHGLKDAAGNITPVSREKAKELVAKVDDATILHAGHTYGALGDGKLLDSLERFINWINEHQEQIKSVIQFLMSIFALFGDESQAVHIIPVHDGVFVAVEYEWGTVWAFV